jgi:hypothetical protein
MSGEIGVKDGEMIVESKGLHLYGYAEELARSLQNCAVCGNESCLPDTCLKSIAPAIIDSRANKDTDAGYWILDAG